MWLKTASTWRRSAEICAPPPAAGPGGPGSPPPPLRSRLMTYLWPSCRSGDPEIGGDELKPFLLLMNSYRRVSHHVPGANDCFVFGDCNMQGVFALTDVEGKIIK